VGSGVVYGVIVALWAVVLVPMWIRRHDAANETRSADRFSQAMRTLSPRPAATGQREMVMPARPQTATRPIVSTTGDPRGAARQRLARRRKRVLLALVATVVVLGAVAAFGVVPWPAVAVPVVLLALYLVNLRLQAKRARAIRRTSSRAELAGSKMPRRTAPQPQAPDSSVVVETKGRSRLWHTVPSAPHSEVVPDAPAPASAGRPLVAEHLVTERLAAALVEPMPIDLPDQPTEILVTPEAGTWQPAEFPLPTYVTAPKAVRPVRVIDLTAPGAWTSGRFLDDALPGDDDAVAQAVAQAEDAADELSALLDRRPAVND